MSKLSRWQIIELAFKQLLREIKSGELRILLAALLLTVTISTAIGYFSSRLHASMASKAGEFLAADLMLQGSSEILQEQLALAHGLHLQHAQTVNFSTVIVHEDEMQLISVKAADDHYPLRGQLKVQDDLESLEYAMDHAPAKGEIWVESRLMHALNLQMNDMIAVGKRPLKITKILTYSPDRSGNFYDLNPFALMNKEDLAATGAVQQGSRVTYRDLWAGDIHDVDRLEVLLKGSSQPHQKILTPKDGNQQINGALARAQNYLNLASLVGVLLASVAIALSANQFAIKRYDDSALLRSLGMQKSQVLWLYGLELCYVSIIAALLGALLGFMVQLGLFELLKDVIKNDLPSGGFMPAIAGIATGFTVLIGCALPPLAALGHTPPLRVLRQDIFPPPLKGFVVYGIAFIALFLIMWQLSLNLGLALALLGGTVIIVGALSFLLYLSLQFLRKLLVNASFVWRIALGQTLRYPVRSMGQIVAFGIILMAMALVLMLRGELLETWKSQLPKDAPNYFALNITEDELVRFEEEIGVLSPNVSPFYPIVMGRLTEINGRAISEVVIKDERSKRSLERDLSLTWTADIPAENKIVAGEWWSENHDGLTISLEDEVAKGYGVTVGDKVTFVIAGETYIAQIGSLRAVNWDTIQPNFYVIFNPNSLQNMPVTYMASFYLPSHMEKSLVNLVKEFPTVTFLDLMALIHQLNSILQQVTLAVEYILTLVLIAGLIVLIAGLQTTLGDRLRQGAILRVLGGQKRLLVKSQCVEFALMGGVAGFLAMLGCELVSFILYRLVLDLSWQPHVSLIMLPFIGALLVAIIAIFGTRRVVTVSPLIVLRE